MWNKLFIQPQVMQSVLRWIKILLQIIGLVSIFILAKKHTSHNFEADKIEEFPSPDAKFKAVLLSNFGGGGGTIHCFDQIYVVPAKSNSETELEKVYEAGCHSLKSNNGPEVKWLEKNRLQIHFSANQGARGVEQLILKGFGAASLVYMTYIVSENSL